MKTSDTLMDLYKDYINAQIELKNIAKDSTGYNYKYTSLEKLIEHTKPILHKYGLAVMQFSVTGGVVTRLIHKSGEWIETELLGETISLAKMNNYQVQGSQHTYYRRYALASICGIASDDDMDAQGEEVKSNSHSEKPVNNSKVSASQVKLIQTRISQLKVDEGTVSMLKSHYSIESWNDLPAIAMKGLIAWFEKREAGE